MAALEELQAVHNKAVQLLNTLRTSNVVVCLAVLEKVMGYILPLSKQLQATNIDLAKAFSHVDTVLNALNSFRSNAEDECTHICNAAKDLLEENGGMLQMPRIVGKQTHRSNIAGVDVITHYRINLFIPFLAHTIIQLTERFAKHRNSIIGLSSLLPQNVDGTSETYFSEIITTYSSILPEKNKTVIEAEYQVWKCTMASNKTFKSALECLNMCDKILHPNMYILLQILATIPVSTATPERTFSSLRRLKKII